MIESYELAQQANGSRVTLFLKRRETWSSLEVKSKDQGVSSELQESRGAQEEKGLLERGL